MTSVRGRGQLVHRSQASKAPTGPPLSNGVHEDPLGSDEPGPSDAPARPLEAPPGPLQAPPLPNVPQDPGAKHYSQQDLDKIIQTFLQNSKGGSGDKLKAKTPDAYYSRSYMDCYNFCQQCELFCHLRSHRAKSNSVCRLLPLGPNQLPLAAAQAEARSRNFGSDLLGQVQGVSLKGPRRFSGLCGQLLDEDHKRLPVSARRSPRLGCTPGASTGCVERI